MRRRVRSVVANWRAMVLNDVVSWSNSGPRPGWAKPGLVVAGGDPVRGLGRLGHRGRKAPHHEPGDDQSDSQGDDHTDRQGDEHRAPERLVDEGVGPFG